KQSLQGNKRSWHRRLKLKVFASPTEQGTGLSAQRRRELDAAQQIYTEADWLELMAKIATNTALSKQLLGDDVNEDNMNKQLGILLMRKRRELAEQSRIKPMNKTQQWDFMRDFMKNQSASVYNHSWTMKQVKALSLAQLKHEFEYIQRTLERSNLLNFKRTTFRPTPLLEAPSAKRARQVPTVDETTPSSLRTRHKQIAKKRATPIVDIADDALIKFDSASDSDDDPLPYAPYVGWEMVPSPLGAVDNLYQREEPDTFALLLTVGVFAAGVYILMLSAATLLRMLNHGLEVPKLVVGGDLTMAEQLTYIILRPNLEVLQIGIKSQGYREPDSEDSTVTYTEVSSPFEDLSDVGSSGVDGLPMMPEEPYAYVQAAMQEPPPLEFVLEPIYPEFMPPEDDVLPTEEQPLPAAVLSTVDSPGYITDFDPEEEEEESSKDDADDEEEDEDEDEEEEKNPASTDSIPSPPVHRTTTRISISAQAPISFLSEVKIERLLSLPTLLPSALTSYSSPLPQIPSPPLLASPTYPLGYRAAMIRLRAESPSTSHPLLPPIVLLHTRASMAMMRVVAPSTCIISPRSNTPPSGRPPLLPIPLPTSSPPLLLSSTDPRECSSAPTAWPTGGFRADYGFVGTLDAEIRRGPDREIELGQRMIDFVTTIRKDTNEIYERLDDAQDDRLLMSGQLNSLHRDRRSHARTDRLMESKKRIRLKQDKSEQKRTKPDKNGKRPEMIEVTNSKVVVAKEKLKEARTHQKSYADKHRRSLEFQPGYQYHPLHVITYPLDQIRTDLSYEEEPEAIIDRQDRIMRKKTIPFIKILWRNHPDREATWETEESIRTSYPHFLP
nr:hypothetical protein [Tanacetum cinerariifolium]